MSDSDTDPLKSLLSSFALGPAWARATGDKRQQHAGDAGPKTEPRAPRRPEREERPDHKAGKHGGERGDRRDRDRGGDRGEFRGRGGKRPFDRDPRPPRDEPPQPATGVRVILIPDPAAIHLIGKEVHQVARVYPLFDVARILLAERGRCQAVFESPEPHPPLFAGKLDQSVFLTREEAQNHLWQPALRERFLDQETVEIDPPSGNFQVVARCGLSGEWLGPPNFHTYQTNLRRIHRERFPHLPFAAYSAKVRTERGEDAVNAWLESMKKRTRWRLKSETGDDGWTSEENDARRRLTLAHFDEAFGETRHAEVLASIPPDHLSPPLMVSLRMAGNHALDHPAILIPAVCKALETEHLPVFKRQGKLHTGPARPHPLPPGQALAERASIMVEWIRANKPAKLEGLWQAVLPEGGTAPPAEFAADLFWLLHQGHILLFTDDTLVVQEVRENTPPAEPEAGETRKKKKKKKKPTAAGPTENPATETQTEAAPAAAEASAAELPEASAEAAEPGNEAPSTPAASDSQAPDAPAPDPSPTEQPPTEQPPTEQPPTEQPPTEQPPTEQPPTEQPPTEQPPTEQPPAEQPPTEQPPAEQPPTEAPPAEEPPTEAPPAEQPPAEQPPAEQPPTEQPPTEQPPTEQPPAEQPPAETPATETLTNEAPTPENPDADESSPKPSPGVDESSSL